MNLNEYNFNVPEFVSKAADSCFDVTADSAVVVGGYRIDNPAAAWVAGAAVRKSASMDPSVVRMIKQACSLFGITDDQFSSQSNADIISISDGVNTAEFNIYDSESLNKAASDLLANRRELPYAFAHDCAAALLDAARTQQLAFNSGTAAPIRKLAGDYNVDFDAGRELLMQAADKATELQMSEHAAVLSKIAGMCSSDCSPQLAPYFIAALDEFAKAVPGLNKNASADNRLPEDVFYLSTAEYNSRRGARQLCIDKTRSIRQDKVSNNLQSISKWAAACGYSINPDSDPESVTASVAKMPTALRDEFIELFA